MSKIVESCLVVAGKSALFVCWYKVLGKLSCWCNVLVSLNFTKFKGKKKKVFRWLLVTKWYIAFMLSVCPKTV